MSKAIVTVQFVVDTDYVDGDYAYLYSNGGSGDIDYDTPVAGPLELFPHGMGIGGWLQTPWLDSPWLLAYSSGPGGWLNQPWLNSPWLLGTAVIKAQTEVYECGAYEFAFKTFDELGNENEGTPGEVTVYVHIAPDAPDGLDKSSYNKTTDILILTAA